MMSHTLQTQYLSMRDLWAAQLLEHCQWSHGVQAGSLCFAVLPGLFWLPNMHRLIKLGSRSSSSQSLTEVGGNQTKDESGGSQEATATSTHRQGHQQQGRRHGEECALHVGISHSHGARQQSKSSFHPASHWIHDLFPPVWIPACGCPVLTAHYGDECPQRGEPWILCSNTDQCQALFQMKVLACSTAFHHSSHHCKSTIPKHTGEVHFQGALIMGFLFTTIPLLYTLRNDLKLNIKTLHYKAPVLLTYSGLTMQTFTLFLWNYRI